MNGILKSLIVSISLFIMVFILFDKFYPLYSYYVEAPYYLSDDINHFRPQYGLNPRREITEIEYENNKNDFNSYKREKGFNLNAFLFSLAIATSTFVLMNSVKRNVAFK